MSVCDLLQLYQRLGLTPIPLKPRSKVPLVKWRNGWNPPREELEAWASRPDTNWGARCGAELAALDFDSEDDFRCFVEAHPEAASWPRVKTARGYHLWVRPKSPIRSQRLDGVELKCIGSYAVAPPSIHPNGTPYTFEVPPDDALPEVDLRELLGLSQIHSLPSATTYESIRRAAPSDFALRYSKSVWPQSMCGKATKVFTRSDGKMKKLLSLRCWKWDCSKCAPLLKRYWLEKLKGLPFRFILRLPTRDKPTKFLRRLGKPRYVHIVANGESWLFLMDDEAEPIWAEAHRAGYDLVAGDIAGDPIPEEVAGLLGEALCREEEPMNARRKITHSKGLFKEVSEGGERNESKQEKDCNRGEDDMAVVFGKEPLTWESEVLMKPITQVADELEQQGWRVIWLSEVEAVAMKDEALDSQRADIVELIESLGVKLKKVGKEYVGLCPFHPDRQPSLSVNRRKGVWHCFGCGRGGTGRDFAEAYRSLGLSGWTSPFMHRPTPNKYADGSEVTRWLENQS